MEITEVRVKLTEDSSDEKLRAFCSVTIDDEFVIRDLKIIGGAKGAFVAMPSRKLADRCPKCKGKNHLRARYCNQCGGRLNPERAERDDKGRPKLHADVAHPINSECRERIQSLVLQEFEAEVERSKQHGYRPPSLDDYYADDFDFDFEILDDQKTSAPDSPRRPQARQGDRRSDSDEGGSGEHQEGDEEFGAGLH
ncbi:MAG: SpoVG family protein [Planctomycetota bacterium]